MSYGTIILDELILTIEAVELDHQAFVLHGVGVAPRDYKRNEVLRGMRVHGQDGSLITSVPDYIQPIGSADAGNTLKMALDVTMDNQTSRPVGVGQFNRKQT